MSCLLGFVQNPWTVGHLKAGSITSVFKTWCGFLKRTSLYIWLGLLKWLDLRYAHEKGVNCWSGNSKEHFWRQKRIWRINTELNPKNTCIYVWTGFIWFRWWSRLVRVEMEVKLCVFFFCVRRLGTWTVGWVSVYRGLFLVSLQRHSAGCVGLWSGFWAPMGDWEQLGYYLH